jgi:mRNA interferase MazF
MPHSQDSLMDIQCTTEYTMNYTLGDIVIVAFPFTDLHKTIRRPALIVADIGDEDVLVARITGQEHETEFEMELKNWAKQGLLLHSYARLSKLATLKRSDIFRKIGNLTDEEILEVKKKLKMLFEIS